MDRRRFLGSMLGAAVAATACLSPEEASAATATASGRAILLGYPCEARNINTGLVLRDAGKDWLVLANNNDTTHMEVIFVDPSTDTGMVYRAPAGQGAEAIQALPGNRLVVGTYYDGKFMVFDIRKREWIETIPFPGEDYLWTFAMGKDGRVYGGSYPGGKLGAFDPTTYTVEDLGAPSKANRYLRNTSALPDGRIFCQAAFNKPETLIFDPATKQFTPAPTALQKAALGVSWNGYFCADNLAYRMPDLTPVLPLPFPVPDPKDGAWSIDLNLTTPETLAIRQGNRLFRVHAGSSTLELWATLPRRGLGTIFGASAEGKIMGVRGQEYFCITPGDKTIDLRRIPGAASPRETMFLRADDRGRLWGGPTFGQTLFYMDVKTRKTVNTNDVSGRGGEVYDVAVIDGICYAVSYIGGEIIRFDPEAKWDQIGGVNPHRIASVGPDYVRPQAGVHIGPDGRLYSGWLAKYGTYGGAIAITDPQTGKTEVIKNPLGPHGIASLAVVGDRVLLGTKTYGNGLGNEKGASAQFGVYDLSANKTIFAQPFPDVQAIGSIVYCPSVGLSACSADGQLWLFDVKKLVFIGNGPAIPDKVTSDLNLRGNALLYGQETALMARDFVTGKIERLADLPTRINKIAVDPTGKVYVACGPAVYEIVSNAGR